MSNKKLCLSAPLANNNIVLEKRLEQKLNDANSSNNSDNEIKEEILFFRDENHKSKKKYKNYKILLL